MKKMIAVMLVLMLTCASALADTVRERIGVPEHTTGEWHSNTGKTHIAVDAVVIVPDVESIDTYAVSGRDATAQDAKNIALAATAGTDWDSDWFRADLTSFERWPGSRDEPKEIIDSSRGSRFFNYTYLCYPPAQNAPCASAGSYNWHVTTALGENRMLAQADYHLMAGENTTVYALNMGWIDPLDIPESAALPGQSLTLSEARAVAEAFAVSVQPDFRLAMAGKAPDSDETGAYAYWFCFTRAIGGMPVTLTSTSSLQDEEEVKNQSYESAPKCETLTCVVDQARILSAELMNPWEVGARIQENVSLLPFERILEIFGTISPLSIQSREMDKEAMQVPYDNAWQINEIRLGYMPVLVKDGSGMWELRPVWDFFGTHTFSFTSDDRPGNSALTIDAINGLIIDRNYGY